MENELKETTKSLLVPKSFIVFALILILNVIFIPFHMNLSRGAQDFIVFSTMVIGAGLWFLVNPGKFFKELIDQNWMSLHRKKRPTFLQASVDAIEHPELVEKEFKKISPFASYLIGIILITIGVSVISYTFIYPQNIFVQELNRERKDK